MFSRPVVVCLRGNFGFSVAYHLMHVCGVNLFTTSASPTEPDKKGREKSSSIPRPLVSTLFG